MIFDTLCGLVERYFPKIERTLRNAKLFWWAGQIEDLPKERSVEDVAFLKENFFLPFPTMAIEDSISCVLIEDIEKEQRGVTSWWRFIECVEITSAAMATDTVESRTDPAGVVDWLETIKAIKEAYGRVYAVTLGKAHLKDIMTDGSYVGVDLDGAFFHLDGRIAPITETDKKIWPMMQKSAVRNFGTALDEIISFNTPDRFVVEVRQASARPPSRAVKILRSHDRPKYTLLTKKQVQTVLGVSSSDQDDRRHPSAHWRRRHFRTFHAERFVQMREKTIVVPACWVGPTEAQVGNKLYKVRIDI